MDSYGLVNYTQRYSQDFRKQGALPLIATADRIVGPEILDNETGEKKTSAPKKKQEDEQAKPEEKTPVKSEMTQPSQQIVVNIPQSPPIVLNEKQQEEIKTHIQTELKSEINAQIIKDLAVTGAALGGLVGGPVAAVVGGVIGAAVGAFAWFMRKQ